MRIEIETKQGVRHQGNVSLKDESFIFLKVGKDLVEVIHWSHIVDNGIYRISKGERIPLKIEVFRKPRE